MRARTPISVKERGWRQFRFPTRPHQTRASLHLLWRGESLGQHDDRCHHRCHRRQPCCPYWRTKQQRQWMSSAMSRRSRSGLCSTSPLIARLHHANTTVVTMLAGSSWIDGSGAEKQEEKGEPAAACTHPLMLWARCVHQIVLPSLHRPQCIPPRRNFYAAYIYICMRTYPHNKQPLITVS